MRWKGRRQSENVEDRRGSRVGGGGVAMGGGLITVIFVVIFLLLGGDPRALLQQQPGGNQPPGVQQPGGQEDELSQFVSVVLADTEDVWTELFRTNLGQRYVPPKLVLFTGQVRSGCGFASAQTGPFYCPADGKVYIDLAFYDELRTRFQAPGDFAMAYVIAHEVGHHVQNQLGTSDQVHAQQQRLGKAEANQLSVRLELQADFLAGVWAHHAHRSKQILEEGDAAEALNAASRIGDDTLQRQAGGRVMPDAFTHGTSEQRMRWFSAGFETGDLSLMNQLFELDYDAL